MISFTTSKKPVLEVLRHMKAGLKSNSKNAGRIFCEVTITKGNVKFAGNGYTIEELEFNNFIPKIEAAKIRLETNIEKASKTLSVYGVRKKELEKMVYKKLKSK